MVKTNPSLAEKENVFISGSLPQLGAWQPNRVALEGKEGVWSGQFQLPKNESIEFKFTKGKWENEALTDQGKLPSNHRFTFTKDTTLTFEITRWKDGDFELAGGITGEVRHHENVEVNGLPNRDVWVWLPPKYEENKEKRYPVLYMHDGQNVFNPATSFTQVDWQVDEWADSLIRNEIIEEIIVVAIENTADRREEYAPSKKGELYVNFICEQLKPQIDSLYRTKPEREHTATMGSSMGGMISFLLVWERNAIFSKAACLSPAFKHLYFNFVPRVQAYKGAKKDLKLYLDNGTEGLETKLQPGIDEMMATLKEKDYEFKWFLDEGAEHNERAWANRVTLPLSYLFGK